MDNKNYWRYYFSNVAGDSGVSPSHSAKSSMLGMVADTAMNLTRNTGASSQLYFNVSWTVFIRDTTASSIGPRFSSFNKCTWEKIVQN